MIEVVNSIPPEVDDPGFDYFEEWLQIRFAERELLPDDITLVDEARARFRTSEPVVAEDQESNILEGFIEKANKEIQQANSRHASTIEDYIEQYNTWVARLIRWRTALRNIARLRAEWSRLRLPIEEVAILYINEQGLIEVEPDILSTALKDVDASRIRECLKCKRILWAGKSNKEYCSAECSGSYRQSKWRENYVEKYKDRRYKKAEGQKKDSDRQA